MKTFNLTQKSEEWKSFRLKHLGASECASILGVSQYEGNTPLDVWEKKTGRSFDTFNGNKFTEYGEKLEPLIMEEYSRFKNMVFENPTCESETHPFISASFDAHNFEHNMIAEYKASMYPKLSNCLRLNSVEAVKEIYPSYFWQVTQQLFVSGASSCDLVTLSKEGELLIVNIPRNEKDIAFMLKGLIEFWEENILKDNAPPPKIPNLTDTEVVSKSKRLEEVQAQIAALQEEEKTLKSDIISAGDDGDFIVGNLQFKRTKPRAKFDKEALYLEFEISAEDIKRFTKDVEGIGFYRVSKK